MERAMGVKDAVRALLERLPDDCNLDQVIDRLYELQSLENGDPRAVPLARAQREELDRRLDLLAREPGRIRLWDEIRRELERED